MEKEYVCSFLMFWTIPTFFHIFQWRIQEFLGGGWLPRAGVRQPISLQKIAENCIKMKEFWPRGGARPWSPLGSATVFPNKESWKSFTQCRARPVADLRGREGRAPPPPGFKFFQFHAVFGKFGKFVCWRPPWGVGTPSLGKSWIRHWRPFDFFCNLPNLCWQADVFFLFLPSAT